MEKFKFNLQQVLKVRLQEEKIQQRVLFEFQSKLQTLINEMSSLYEQKNVMSKELKQAEKVKFDGRTRRIYSEFNEKTDKMIAVVRKKIKVAEQDVNKERLKLLEVVKKRKSLENIKEKKELEYYYEQRKEEQKFLDEIGIGKIFAKSKK